MLLALAAVSAFVPSAWRGYRAAEEVDARGTLLWKRRFRGDDVRAARGDVR
jgi:hypothetical protein